MNYWSKVDSNTTSGGTWLMWPLTTLTDDDNAPVDAYELLKEMIEYTLIIEGIAHKTPGVRRKSYEWFKSCYHLAPVFRKLVYEDNRILRRITEGLLGVPTRGDFKMSKNRGVRRWTNGRMRR